MSHIVDILKCLKELNNFNGIFQIVGGLGNASVYRLTKTFEVRKQKQKKNAKMKLRMHTQVLVFFFLFRRKTGDQRQKEGFGEHAIFNQAWEILGKLQKRIARNQPPLHSFLGCESELAFRLCFLYWWAVFSCLKKKKFRNLPNGFDVHWRR